MTTEINRLDKEYRIVFLGKRALGLARSQDFVDWAISELVDGLDSPYLRILAGLSEPLDALEVERVFKYSLKELELKFPSIQVCRWQYIRLLVQKILDAESLASFPMDILSELYDISESIQRNSTLWIWSKIYYAWDEYYICSEFENSSIIYYLEGATEDNILELTKMEAAKFLEETKNLELLEPILIKSDISKEHQDSVTTRNLPLFSIRARENLRKFFDLLVRRFFSLFL